MFWIKDKHLHPSCSFLGSTVQLSLTLCLTLQLRHHTRHKTELIGDFFTLFFLSVASISDVVKRYRRVLKHVQRGFRMTTAFKKARVSRNAVKDTAAIAEIYIADKSLLSQFKGKYTLLKLAQICQKKIVGELAEKIIEMKNNKQLIPFSAKKDWMYAGCNRMLAGYFCLFVRLLNRQVLFFHNVKCWCADGEVAWPLYGDMVLPVQHVYFIVFLFVLWSDTLVNNGFVLTYC